MANRKIQIIKDAGSPHWNVGDTPQDPDGNNLLRSGESAAPQPVAGLKNATVVASGSYAITAQPDSTIITFSNTQSHLFHWQTCYYSPGSSNTMVVQIKSYLGYYFSQASPGAIIAQAHALYLEYNRTGGATTSGAIHYKVYRIDEA